MRDPDSQQVIATNYFVGTTELTAYPSRYQAIQPRNHGGIRARRKNPTCRSDRLQKRVIKHTMVICMECGEVQSDDTSDETVMPIGWFNDTHPLERILPRQGDYANLPGQHHPSISYYPPDRTHAYEYWYDHGGTHQHGDAFELYRLVSGRSKSKVLRDLRAECSRNDEALMIRRR